MTGIHGHPESMRIIKRQYESQERLNGWYDDAIALGKERGVVMEGTEDSLEAYLRRVEQEEGERGGGPVETLKRWPVVEGDYLPLLIDYGVKELMTPPQGNAEDGKAKATKTPAVPLVPKKNNNQVSKKSHYISLHLLGDADSVVNCRGVCHQVEEWKEEDLIQYVYRRLNNAKAVNEQRVYVVELAPLPLTGPPPSEPEAQPSNQPPVVPRVEEDEGPLKGSTLVFGKRAVLLQIQEVGR